MSGFERTESDMEEALRQKTIMNPMLTSRFGVMESFDFSISQAGVWDTNLLITILGISSSLSLIIAKKFRSH